MDNNNIREYLEHLAKGDQFEITERLEERSVLSKVSRIVGEASLSYVIDDIDADKKVIIGPDGKIPYFKICKAFEERDESLAISMYGGRKLVPFSEVLEKGGGECLEKSILTQLIAQRGRQSFLVNGGLIQKNGFFGNHAYNIVEKEGAGYFLVDTQRPLIHEGGKISPFIAPLIDIKSDGDLVLDERWRFDEVYTLSN